jgi:alpha/beta superfamily hydrolase
VICHPHPQYGGDMDVPLVLTIAEALVDAGVAALRFNFGGVGASEGTYGGGEAEQCDVGAAEAALASHVPAGTPIAIVGYSFGAWVGARAALGLPRVTQVVAVAPPLSFFDWQFAASLGSKLAVVVGDRDQYCPREALDRFASANRLRPTIVAGADHFFGAGSDVVGRAVVELLAVRRG